MASVPGQIAYPDESIYRYRQARANPSVNILTREQGRVDFIFDHWDYPEAGGVEVWFRDCPFPQTGPINPQAVYAANSAKRLIVSSLRAFAQKNLWLVFLAFGLTPNKKKIAGKFLEALNASIWIFLEPYILKVERYSRFSAELRRLILSLLVSLGIEGDPAEKFADIIATIFDLDNAYRFRMQDLLGETTGEAFSRHPATELAKLLSIYCERQPLDPNEGRKKYEAGIGFLQLLIKLWPQFRKAWKRAVGQADFSKLQPNQADMYHMLLFTDYDYGGRSIEERKKMYIAYHEKNPPFPPRAAFNFFQT
ncbi:MAG: hypothetical protein KGJ90_06515 [Patescibacteria group bacterium]|nr:hypothetical protein [Patescibacteria group bacterium]